MTLHGDSDVRVAALGELQAWRDGNQLDLGPLQQQVVLAILLLQANRPVSRRAIIDAVWGGEAPKSVVNLVQRHASGIRHALEPNRAARSLDSRLAFRGGAYTLSIPAGALDVEVFEAALARAKRARVSGRPDEAAEALRNALALWRGPLCDGLSSPFLDAERDRLAEQRVGALADRIELDLELGSASDLVSELRRLIAEHPSHERLHGLLMRALYREGRAADALDAYASARRHFRDHLGLEPSTSLRDIQRRVLNADPTLAAPLTLFRFEPLRLAEKRSMTPGPSLTGPATDRIWNVPGENPHFTGREELLAELRRRLRSGQATQALYGMGGVGKSQLALQYAHQFAADYDLVWWINAEQPVLIPGQLTTLAARLGLASGPTVADTVARLLAELHGRSRWLLIFDNAERATEIADYVPGGEGCVIITSRSPAWGALGGRVEVDLLKRDETIALLRARMPTMDRELADELAAELGDLPLAAAQAAAYLEQTDLRPEEYLRRFRTRRETLLARGEVLGYHGRIDTTWALSIERLRAEDCAAVQLLEIAAFLAPEPIPLALFSGHGDLLAEPLRTLAADEDLLGDTVGALVGYSLVRRHPHGFQVHRLVQAVIRNQLSLEQQRAICDEVVALLAAGSPGDPEDPRTWPGYLQFTPHVLAVQSGADNDPAVRRLLLDTARYLHTHGDSSSSRAVSEPLLRRWRSALGPDHPDALSAASILTLALIEVGEAEPARALGEDALERCRRVLGPDHPTTLWAAAAVTAALVGLGRAEATRALGEDTFERCGRVLGQDHATTLWTAVNLAVAHVLLGHAGPARDLGEDTLERCRRTLGPDQPTTLWAAAAQTLAMVEFGQAELARALGEDTLERGRQVLGKDHSTTLTAAAALSRGLHQLGEAAAAEELRQDTVERSRRALGPDNPLALYLTRPQDLLRSDARDANPS